MPRQNPPETCSDHYLFWKTRPTQVEFHVKLQHEQRPPFDAALPAIEYLGNPARKLRRDRDPEDVHHPSIHLVAYRVFQQPPPPEPVVVVHNQFRDSGEWKLGPLQFLFIPARKAKGDEPDPTSPPPPRVDHYACYKAEGPDVEETFQITDQFGEYRFVYIKPVMFGIPVNKNDEGFVHPNVHLAIYEIFEAVRPPAHVGVRTYDQLGPQKLNCVETTWLAVPSFRR